MRGKARRGQGAKASRTGAKARLDRFDLYELAVTAPQPLARFLKAVHGRNAKVLGEDFSGTAALSRAWVEMDPRHYAVAVDKRLSIARRIDTECSRLGIGSRVSALPSDVRDVIAGCDILACTNFPICYWHTRADLIAYLRHAKSRLNSRGIFVADLYGGSDAFQTGSRSVRIRHDGHAIRYTWEQRQADPKSGRVRNAIHFRVGSRVLRNAFEYDWRLWSIPELSDAMKEAGLRTVTVYDELGGAMDQRGRLIVRPAKELSDPFVVYVVARK